LGIYQVDVEHPASPTLVTERIAETSGNGEFFIYPDGNATIVQRAATGEQHVIENGGRRVNVSPDGKRLLWQVVDRRGDFDRRRNQTWVASIDGSGAHVVGESVGTGQSEWIDGLRILLVGLPLENTSHVGIAVLTLGAYTADDQLLQLAQVSRPREILVSPGGNWLVYSTFFQIDPDDDGLWIAATDGSQPPRKLDFFGSYQWSDDTHLFYAPLESDVESHTLWVYDVIRGESRRLTDPMRTRFKIANNDWIVSRDGLSVAFSSATDHNLWVIDLAP
jgi:hypothetical protein